MKILIFSLAGLAFILLVAATYFYLAYLKPIKAMQPGDKYNVGVTNFDYCGCFDYL